MNRIETVGGWAMVLLIVLGMNAGTLRGQDTPGGISGPLPSRRMALVIEDRLRVHLSAEVSLYLADRAREARNVYLRPVLAGESAIAIRDSLRSVNPVEVQIVGHIPIPRAHSGSADGHGYYWAMPFDWFYGEYSAPPVLRNVGGAIAYWIGNATASDYYLGNEPEASVGRIDYWKLKKTATGDNDQAYEVARLREWFTRVHQYSVGSYPVSKQAVAMFNASYPYKYMAVESYGTAVITQTPGTAASVVSEMGFIGPFVFTTDALRIRAGCINRYISYIPGQSSGWNWPVERSESAQALTKPGCAAWTWGPYAGYSRMRDGITTVGEIMRKYNPSRACYATVQGSVIATVSYRPVVSGGP